MCLKVSAALHSSHYPGVMTAVYLRPALSSSVVTSAANRLIGEVVQSRRRPLLGPSPG